MIDGAYGPVYEPLEITEDMIPKTGEVFWDTYAAKFRGVDRSITVADVQELGVQGCAMWDIVCVENGGFGRRFTMRAHGFLSRYAKAL